MRNLESLKIVIWIRVIGAIFWWKSSCQNLVFCKRLGLVKVNRMKYRDLMRKMGMKGLENVGRDYLKHRRNQDMIMKWKTSYPSRRKWNYNNDLIKFRNKRSIKTRLLTDNKKVLKRKNNKSHFLTLR